MKEIKIKITGEGKTYWFAPTLNPQLNDYLYYFSELIDKKGIDPQQLIQLTLLTDGLKVEVDGVCLKEIGSHNFTNSYIKDKTDGATFIITEETVHLVQNTISLTLADDEIFDPQKLHFIVSHKETLVAPYGLALDKVVYNEKTFISNFKEEEYSPSQEAFCLFMTQDLFQEEFYPDETFLEHMLSLHTEDEQGATYSDQWTVLEYVPEDLDIYEIRTSTRVIGAGAFEGNANLRYIDIPEGVETIEEEAFLDNKNLTFVNLPKSLKEIGDGAFRNCENLKLINIPDGLEVLGVAAFKDCKRLEAIYIPDSVNEIGGGALLGCTGLQMIHSNYLSEKGNYLVKDGVMVTALDPQCTLHDDITAIADFAYDDCTELLAIHLPDTVKSIGKSAFRNCKKLAYVHYSQALEYIDREAFKNCKSLTSAELPNSVSFIGEEVFRNCGELIMVKLPEQLTSLPIYAFNECHHLKFINLPETLTEINKAAFAYCTDLRFIKLPESITLIDALAFSYCTNLTEINIPEGLTSITEDLFRDCVNLASIQLPEGLTDIRECAFSGCSRLTSINLPQSLVFVDEKAFQDCNHLEKIYVSKDNLAHAQEILSNTTLKGLLTEKN